MTAPEKTEAKAPARTLQDALALLERRRKERRWQDNVELVASTIILALMIRAYAAETFVIPTGSMAPTLRGEHFQFACQNCASKLATRASSHSDNPSLRCERCGSRVNLSAQAAASGGDKIIVDKLAYRFGSPERFDIAVFRYPHKTHENYIKRIIGLPGERLKAEHGDLLVNGKRVQKPDAVQESLWQSVYDQSAAALARAPQPWTSEPEGRWDWLPPGAPRVGAASSVGGSEAAFLAGGAAGRSRLRFAQAIQDDYPYNAGTMPQNIVADLRIRATITPFEAGEPVRLIFVENGLSLSLSLPTREGEDYNLERPGPKPASLSGKGAALRVKAVNEVSASWCDRRLRLVVNGETVLDWTDPAPKDSIVDSGVVFDGPPGGMMLRNVRLDRDIVYFSHGVPSQGRENLFDEASGEYVIPEDNFLGFGDNQLNSSDGRVWGTLERGHLVGRALGIFWPALRIGPIR
jgi:signal peptidase I